MLEGYAQEQEEHWSRTRMLAYYMLVPHQKKGSRLKPKDLFTLPSEVQNQFNGKVSKVYRLTPEEIKQWHAGTWQAPVTDNQ